MGGDQTHTYSDISQTPAAATPGDGRSLLEHSGFLDRVKHGATALGRSAADLVHKGVKAGEDLAAKPQARQITYDVVQAGREIAQQHVNEVNGVIKAGKNGDVKGVIQKGLPLVGEAALGPQGAALKIIKDRAAQAVIDHSSSSENVESKK